MLEQWFDVEYVMELAEKYKALGPFVGILLPMIESFLPFLPLFVFVFANAGAYGLLKGFVLSWIGTVIGSYAVFLLVRKYGRNKILKRLTTHSKVEKLIFWVERNGFGPLFLLICFPFTPSALVNFVAGLSDLKRTHYLFILMMGKFVMIFTISFIGYDLRALFTQPLRTALLGIFIALLWFVGKRVEAHLNAKVEKDFNELTKK